MNLISPPSEVKIDPSPTADAREEETPKRTEVDIEVSLSKVIVDGTMWVEQPESTTQSGNCCAEKEEFPPCINVWSTLRKH